MKKSLRLILMIAGACLMLYGAQHITHIVTGFLLSLIGTEANPYHIGFFAIGLILYGGSLVLAE